MDYKLFDKLHQEELIGEASFDRINQERKAPLLSVYWDINVLLGIGVIGLSTGLGILIYKNIDTIGHQVVLALICSIAVACFIYCEQKKLTHLHSLPPIPVQGIWNTLWHCNVFTHDSFVLHRL
jgi:hypothetical protein